MSRVPNRKHYPGGARDTLLPRHMILAVERIGMPFGEEAPANGGGISQSEAGRL